MDLEQRKKVAQQAAKRVKERLFKKKIEDFNTISSRSGWILLKVNKTELTPGNLYGFEGEDCVELILAITGEVPIGLCGEMETVDSKEASVIMFLGEEHFPDKETNEEPSFVFLYKDKKYILTEKAARNLRDYDEK